MSRFSVNEIGEPITLRWPSANTFTPDPDARFAALRSYVFACARKGVPADLAWLARVLAWP